MNQQDRIKREKFRTALATAILIAAAAAVFALVLFGLYKINMIQLPAALEKLFGTPETSAPHNGDDGDEERIYASLSGTPAVSDDYALEYGINPAVLLEMLKSAASETSYYTEAQIVLSVGGKSYSRVVKLSRDGEKYRAEIFEGGAEPTLIVCDGEQIRYTDYSANGKPQSRDFPADGDFSLEYQLGLPSLGNILEENPEEDLKVTLLRSENENLYCVEYTHTDLPQREIFYVSIKYNFIVSAETYYEDELVYKLNTTSFSTVTSFVSDYFSITGES